MAIPRNLPSGFVTKGGKTILTLDELSGMVAENLKGRESAVKDAENLISSNAEKEFLKLQNRKTINAVQKKFREEQSDIKLKAIKKAREKLSEGDEINDVIEELADEIASKNAFHVSKILDDSMSSKNRG